MSCPATVGSWSSRRSGSPTTRTRTSRPLPGDWTSDTVVYHAEAGGEASDPATVRLWVAPVNDAPSFTPGPTVIVDQDSGAYSGAWATDVSPGPANEGDQTVTFEVTAVDDDGIGVFAEGPAIAADGTLTFTPAAGKVAAGRR